MPRTFPQALLATLRHAAPFLLLCAIFWAIWGGWVLTVGRDTAFLTLYDQGDDNADLLMLGLTELGGGIGILGALIGLLFRSVRASLTAGLAWASSGILSSLLKKQVFHEALRPRAWFESIGHPLTLIRDVELHRYNSFPSGHSITAFALACALCCVLPGRRLQRFWWALAICVAWSRVYIGQHFPTDILAGSVIGVLCALPVAAALQLPDTPWLDYRLTTHGFRPPQTP